MTFHIEILPETQRTVLSSIGPLAEEIGFYLAGGTAVALQLGHRQSVDFDWFTDKSIESPLALAKAFERRGLPLVVDSVATGTLHARLLEVRVTFLEYGYPLLRPLKPWTKYKFHMASLDDLACMKLAAVAGRGAKKDFVDIYALVRRHRPLDELIALYRRKYDLEDVGHLRYALAYFDDAELEPMPKMHEDVSWAEVKRALRLWLAALP